MPFVTRVEWVTQTFVGETKKLNSADSRRMRCSQSLSKFRIVPPVVVLHLIFVMTSMPAAIPVLFPRFVITTLVHTSPGYPSMVSHVFGTLPLGLVPPLQECSPSRR